MLLREGKGIFLVMYNYFVYSIYIGSTMDYVFRSAEHFKHFVLDCKFARFDLSTECDMGNLKENLTNQFREIVTFPSMIYIHIHM